MPRDIHEKLMQAPAGSPGVSLAQLPTPMHRLQNFGRLLHGLELWIKRDDLSGFEGGGNKTRKLEFLVADAVAAGSDMLVPAGAVQSNHTRPTTADSEETAVSCSCSSAEAPPCTPTRTGSAHRN